MTIFLLGAAGLLAGAMNALAGGGSFVTLPALIAMGLPPVAANASSTVALCPAGFTSAWVYRDGLGDVCGVRIAPMIAITLAGGLTGSLLLLRTPAAMFDDILPWLLLAATAMLACGRRIAAQGKAGAGKAAVLSIQFGLGAYGGYFGGAVGLMMMAAWRLLGGADIKALNAPRTLLVSVANAVAILCFAQAGVVRWPETAMLGLGAMLGGYAGAWLGRSLDPGIVRMGTLAMSAAITVGFFVRAYG